jgi:hypothetical protein
MAWNDLNKDEQQHAWNALVAGSALEGSRPARYRAELLRRLPDATKEGFLALAGRLVRPIPMVAEALRERASAIIHLLT